MFFFFLGGEPSQVFPAEYHVLASLLLLGDLQVLEGDWCGALARIPAIEWQDPAVCTGIESGGCARDEATALCLEQKYLELLERHDVAAALHCLRKELSPVLSRIENSTTQSSYVKRKYSATSSISWSPSSAAALNAVAARKEAARPRAPTRVDEGGSRLHMLAAALVCADATQLKRATGWRGTRDGSCAETVPNISSLLRTSPSSSSTRNSLGGSTEGLVRSGGNSSRTRDSSWGCKTRHVVLLRVQRLMAPSEGCGAVPEGRLESLLHQAINWQVEHCVFHNPRCLIPSGRNRTSSTSSSISSYTASIASRNYPAPSLLTMSLFEDHDCGLDAIPTRCLCVLGDDQTHKESSEIWCVVFSPDGSRLASASSDGMVMVWDATTLPFRPLYHLDTSGVSDAKRSGVNRSNEGDSHEVEERLHLLAFSGDGSRLLGCGESHLIYCWSLPPRANLVESWRRRQHSIPEHKWGGIRQHDEGSKGGADSDTSSEGSKPMQHDEHCNANFADVISPSGIATDVEGVSLSTPMPLQSSFEFLVLGSAYISGESAVVDDEDCGHFVSVGRQRRRSTSTEKAQKHTKSVSGVAWLDDHGRRFLSCSLDKRILLWDLDHSSSICLWSCTSRIIGFAISGDKQILVVACADQQIIVFAIEVDDRKDGETVAETQRWLREVCRDCFPCGPLVSIALSADGRWALVACKKENRAVNPHASHRLVEGVDLHCWDIEKRRVLLTYDGHVQGQYVIQSCFGGHNETFVASGSEDARVYLWHTQTGCLGATLQGHTATVNAVAWSPVDPHVFVSASDDATLRVWGAAK
jgi:WD40 repeat protein